MTVCVFSHQIQMLKPHPMHNGEHQELGIWGVIRSLGCSPHEQD